jgi:hypothetical protein
MKRYDIPEPTMRWTMPDKDELEKKLTLFLDGKYDEGFDLEGNGLGKAFFFDLTPCVTPNHLMINLVWRDGRRTYRVMSRLCRLTEGGLVPAGTWV